MPYAIETFEGGRRVSRAVIDEGEEQAITRAKELKPSQNVTLIKLVKIESEGDENGVEVWSERRRT